jgi:hypothetical protein
MNIIHIADILAIPLFLLMIIYFSQKQNKTIIEYILLLFGIGGLIFDICFSIYYIFMKKTL